MIKNCDVRIGNYLMTTNYSLVTIKEIHNTVIACQSESSEVKYYNNCLVGIPITQLWLVDLGFKNTGLSLEKDVNEFTLVYLFNKGMYDDFQFYLKGNGGYDESGGMDLEKTIIYVHQLQNLYHSLTGEELQIEEI